MFFSEDYFTQLDQRKSSLVRRRRGLFSKPEVAALIGIPYFQLHYAIKVGHFAQPTKGNGRRKYYDAQEAVAMIRAYGTWCDHSDCRQPAPASV
jgi:hypothetical protein